MRQGCGISVEIKSPLHYIAGLAVAVAISVPAPAAAQKDEAAAASIWQRLDVDWTYQLAGSLLRPRKTNVCRQSG